MEISFLVNSTNRVCRKDMHTRYKPLSLGVRMQIVRFSGFAVIRFKFPESWGKKRITSYLTCQLPWRKLRRIAIGVGVKFTENPFKGSWEEILGVFHYKGEAVQFTN